MEEFLPGLVKMVEERFGKKPTTGFVLLLVLGISAWLAKLLWDNAIWPVYTLVSRLLAGIHIEAETVWDGVLGGAIACGIAAVAFLIMMYLYRRFVERPVRKLFEEVQSTHEDSEEVLERADKLQERTKALVREAEDVLDKARNIEEIRKLLDDEGEAKP